MDRPTFWKVEFSNLKLASMKSVKGAGCIDQSSLSEELPTLSSFHLEDPSSGKETSERQSFRKVLIFC